jgi:hypothetical protein
MSGDPGSGVTGPDIDTHTCWVQVWVVSPTSTINDMNVEYMSGDSYIYYQGSGVEMRYSVRLVVLNHYPVVLSVLLRLPTTWYIRALVWFGSGQFHPGLV